jgi:hypothetical protein
MSGVVSGITMTAGMPRVRAPSATPCAWLPAEAQMTPRCARSARAARSCCRRREF